MLFGTTPVVREEEGKEKALAPYHQPILRASNGLGMTNPLIHGFYLNFTDGELYTATVSDFSGTDPLIYKEPLRTVQFDSKHLNGT